MTEEERDFKSTVERELQVNGVYVTKTSGVSMEPLFRTHRDAVMIVPPSAELSKYDIALYTYGDGRFILHRVIGVRDDVYLIRGDNTYITERVPKGRVIGVVSAFNRKGKRYDLSEFSYKFYSRFWNYIYPVRYVLNLVKRVLSKIKRTIFKNKRKNTGQN